MHSVANFLEAHDKLAGWAQFVGAMLALAATYFTAFVPIWRHKRQLKNAAIRLLANGYEALESYHRTTPYFLPVSLTLKGAALAFGCVIEEINRFPIYELDDQSSGSLARQLVTMNMQLVSTRLLFENMAAELSERQASAEDRDSLVEFLNERLELVRKMLAGEKLERPVWPGSPSNN